LRPHRTQRHGTASRARRGGPDHIRSDSHISYEDLLENWFFKLHDPTTLNRQGNDIGTQYRSAICPQNAEQERTAEQVKARVDASGRWLKPITTTIEPASTWYDAEEYHQDYLRKHPGGYTCHYMRTP
jgi:methionine-S-sulfoxide reductase